MKKLLLIISIPLFIVGCSTIQNIPKSSPYLIDGDKARIRLIRQNEFFGSARIFNIYSNNQNIGQIGLEGKLEWDVNPGIITIERKVIDRTTENNSVTFTVKAGYVYTIDVIWAGFYQNPKISSIEKEGIKISFSQTKKGETLNYISNKKNFKLLKQSNPDLNFLDFIEGTKNASVFISEEWGEKFEKGDDGAVKFANTITKHLHSLGFSYVAISKEQNKYLSTNESSICNFVFVNYRISLQSNYIDGIWIEFMSCLNDRYIFGSNDIIYANENNIYQKISEAFNSIIYFKKERNVNKRLELPYEMTDWNEQKIKSYFDENGTFEIEGIYERLKFGKDDDGGAKYKIGIINNNNNGFDAIYLDGAHNYLDWKEGEVKATIIKTGKPYFYKVDWKMGNKFKNEDVYASLDKNDLLNFVFADGNDVDPDVKYIKLYPIATGNFSTPSTSSNYTSSGTGFFIEKSGYIVTNHHVIDGMKKIDVFINEGTLTTKKYDAKVEIKDKASDLAIIKIIDNNFNEISQIPYSINTGLLKIGEDVFTLGYPLINTMGESIKLTSGIISSKVGYNDDLNSYQISVPIQPGNSGGPLFDLEGNIVGVINAMHLNTDNVGYAIKANVLSNILDLVEIKILSNNKINNKKLSYFGEKYSGYVVIIKGY